MAPADKPDGDYAFFNGMAPDGSRVYYAHYQAPSLGRNLWEWVDGVRTLVSTGPSYAGATDPGLLAVSTDGTRVVFMTDKALVPEDADGSWIDIYVREGTTTTLVSTGPTDPNGTGVDEGAWFVAASPDAREIVWQTAGAFVPEDSDSRTDHYLTRNGTTTILSLGTTGGNGDLQFTNDVQPEGNVYDPVCGCLRVYFATQEALTAEDTDTNRDAYESADGTLRLVTPDSTAEADDHWAEFNGASPDGSRVFFTTNGPPFDGGFAGTYLNVDGNLYRVGGSGNVQDVSADGRRVVMFAGGGLIEWVDGVTRSLTGAACFCGAMGYRGSVYVFATSESIDPADTDGYVDVYASDGARTRLVTTQDIGPGIAIRAISDDGSTFFVNTYQGLVPGDVDGKQDLYRFSVLHDDRVELLSTTSAGDIDEDVAFEGASSDGFVVAMYTMAGLVPEDDEPGGTGAATDSYVTVPTPGTSSLVAAGGSTSTGDVATADHPVVTSVTSPVAGAVTIQESSTADPPPAGSGYTFLDQQLTSTPRRPSAAEPADARVHGRRRAARVGRSGPDRGHAGRLPRRRPGRGVHAAPTARPPEPVRQPARDPVRRRRRGRRPDHRPDQRRQHLERRLGAAVDRARRADRRDRHPRRYPGRRVLDRSGRRRRQPRSPSYTVTSSPGGKTATVGRHGHERRRHGPDQRHGLHVHGHGHEHRRHRAPARRPRTP